MYENHMGGMQPETKNEIAMSNLFAAANNPKIMEKVDSKHREILYEILASYVDLSIENFMATKNRDARAIREDMGR